MQFLLDTDTCIRFMKGQAATLTRIQSFSRDAVHINYYSF
jgi:predicted nucleic acid-binding protein